MEVVAQPGNVVLVRMTEQERVHIQTTFNVPLQSIPEIGCHIRRVIVIVVSITSNVNIDENRLAVVQPDQRHIAVRHRKKTIEATIIHFPISKPVTIGALAGRVNHMLCFSAYVALLIVPQHGGASLREQAALASFVYGTPLLCRVAFGGCRRQPGPPSSGPITGDGIYAAHSPDRRRSGLGRRCPPGSGALDFASPNETMTGNEQKGIAR